MLFSLVSVDYLVVLGHAEFSSSCVDCTEIFGNSG